jgi:hypothetical protein
VLGGLLAALWCATAVALDVVAEAEAPIVNDDMTLARLTALRRAKIQAIEQSRHLLQVTTTTTPAGVHERATVTSPGRALDARILNEYIHKGNLRLTAEVRIAEPGQAATCTERPLRKALVTTFPLRYPEQIHHGEFMGWPQMTAEELARLLNQHGRLLSAPAPSRIPFASVDTAPEAERKDGVPRLVQWASQARAQYVIAGVFRDFGTTKKILLIPERQMIVEAYIFDGISGELLARREFAKQASFSWQMPKTLTPGSRAFSESQLGQTYYELLGEIGPWAEDTISCLPFSTRVIRAEGNQLHIDVGSDSGIEPGMELVLTQTASAPVSTAGGDVLAGQRVPVAGVIIKNVQPRYSVAEITARKNLPAVRPGDVLYGL